MQNGGAALETSPRRLLHVGCGTDPAWPCFEHCQETRLDINPEVEPDLIASMTDLGQIGEYDHILCSHALEHLYPHEVKKALSEFLRVLKPGGTAIILVPDLEGVEPTDKELGVSAAGPIAGFDLFYGLRSRLETNPYMAHHCGFVRDTLEDELRTAGFVRPSAVRQRFYNLLGVGFKA